MPRAVSGGLLGRRDDFIIPWNCIKRIGPDIVLVEAKPDDCRVPREGQLGSATVKWQTRRNSFPRAGIFLRFLGNNACNYAFHTYIMTQHGL